MRSSAGRPRRPERMCAPVELEQGARPRRRPPNRDARYPAAAHEVVERRRSRRAAPARPGAGGRRDLGERRPRSAAPAVASTTSACACGRRRVDHFDRPPRRAPDRCFVRAAHRRCNRQHDAVAGCALLLLHRELELARSRSRRRDVVVHEELGEVHRPAHGLAVDGQPHRDDRDRGRRRDRRKGGAVGDDRDGHQARSVRGWGPAAAPRDIGDEPRVARGTRPPRGTRIPERRDEPRRLDVPRYGQSTPPTSSPAAPIGRGGPSGSRCGRPRTGCALSFELGLGVIPARATPSPRRTAPHLGTPARSWARG